MVSVHWQFERRCVIGKELLASFSVEETLSSHILHTCSNDIPWRAMYNRWCVDQVWLPCSLYLRAFSRARNIPSHPRQISVATYRQALLCACLPVFSRPSFFFR
ncbi:unnamed protein product [Sphacelaria rigidula]